MFGGNGERNLSRQNQMQVLACILGDERLALILFHLRFQLRLLLLQCGQFRLQGLLLVLKGPQLRHFDVPKPVRRPRYDDHDGEVTDAKPPVHGPRGGAVRRIGS